MYTFWIYPITASPECQYNKDFFYINVTKKKSFNVTTTFPPYISVGCREY